MRSLIGTVLCTLVWSFALHVSAVEEIPLYRTFERVVTNTGSYANKFTDVQLQTSFTHQPSGRTIDFIGFFDGNGDGTGSATEGTVWRFRFMPDALGTWNYTWSWSDGTSDGSGSFECIEAGRGKGILKPYVDNPRWFAYNGTEPVFLKSYYSGEHLNEDPDWVGPNVWQKLLDRGYNHIQSAGLPIAYVEESWQGEVGAVNKVLFYNDDPKSQMQLDVWKNLDGCVRWCSEHDLAMHLFQGFHGKKQFIVNWGELDTDEKEFYVAYVCARLAAYQAIAGWCFSWEVNGPVGSSPYHLAQLLSQYDPFDHMRSFHKGSDTNHALDVYDFASLFKGTYADMAALNALELNKPLFVSENRDLWRSCYSDSANAKRTEAWMMTMAGATFTWNWVAGGICGDPNDPDDLFASTADEQIDILYGIMENDLTFYQMGPHDDLLSGQGTDTHCLAEPGAQYCVSVPDGGSFSLQMASGTYQGHWVDCESGSRIAVSSPGGNRSFTTPSTGVDWALVLVLDDPNNNAPVITAVTADPEPVSGTTTQLSVTANDPDGDPITIDWATSSSPPGSTPEIGSGDAPVATFDVAGVYVFTVTVADDRGDSATDTVTVTVDQMADQIEIIP